MKYSEEQIREKYGDNAIDILGILSYTNYELGEDDLVISLLGDDEDSEKNILEVIEVFTEDFSHVTNILFSEGYLESFIELGYKNDKEKMVEFISLEDKIIKINLIPLRLMFIKTLLSNCSDIQGGDKIHMLIPFYFIFNAKTNYLTVSFLSNFETNTNIPKNFLCAQAKVIKPVEIRPNLKVVNGEKE